MTSSLTDNQHLSNKYTLYLSILGCVFCLISLIFFQQDYYVARLAEKISHQQEREIGEELFDSQRDELVDDTDTIAKFDALTAKLVNNSKDLDDYQYSVYLKSDEQVNAFALPGGFIVINTGLIMEAQTPEEILGVLGHEMAHVRERHVLRGFIHALGWYGLVGITTGPNGLIAFIATNGSSLITRQYSRHLETEADEIAIEILEKAQISPRGLKDFFTRMQIRQGDNGFSLLSTHPAIESRIERLDQLANTKNTYPPVEFDLDALKRSIKELDLKSADQN